MSRSSITRAWVAAAFVAALVLAAAPAAYAHAAYKSSTPGDGESVSGPPTQVTAEFTEPITDASYLEVYDPCGVRVDDGSSQISGYNMSVGMSADKAGRYTVEFAAQSVDTHITYGSFTFTSTGGASCAGEQPPPSGNGGGGSGGSGGGGGSTGSGGGPAAGGTGSALGSGSASGSGGSGTAATGGGGGSGTAGPAARGKHREHSATKPDGKGSKPVAQGPRTEEPVPFENTGGRAPAPAAWDLPIGGVVMALALCVMIGAAGGRVYAGIVAPPRR